MNISAVLEAETETGEKVEIRRQAAFIRWNGVDLKDTGFATLELSAQQAEEWAYCVKAARPLQKGYRRIVEIRGDKLIIGVEKDPLEAVDITVPEGAKHAHKLHVESELRSLYEGESLEGLQQQATMSGVDYEVTWTKAKLIDEIVAAELPGELAKSEKGK